MKNIVLVHGGFVDGSGWEGVYRVLKHDGYDVSIVQNPTISLDGDVVATKRVLAGQDGPAILVGHSYGGAVITQAGNDSKVAGLVYITAFAPDKGESVASLIKNPPPGAPVPPIVEAPSGTISEPAWKSKPSWYLIATDDKMIPPDAQRFMSKRAGSTVVEAKGSHAIYVSQPRAVAALIEQAAKSLKTAAA